MPISIPYRMEVLYMSIIPEVTCRRCGAKFSALRSECPNCGTRRVTQSGRTPSATPGTVKGTASYERAETNTKWQMIFGLILVVAVILAVIVMVSTTLSGDGPADSGKNTSAPIMTDDLGAAAPTPEAPPTVAPTQTPTLERIAIMYLNTEMIDDWVVEPTSNSRSPALRLNMDETLNFKPQVFPVTITVDPSNFKWSVDDESAVELTPKEDGSVDVHILAVKQGGVKLTVEAFGITGTCRIYCIEGG